MKSCGGAPRAKRALAGRLVSSIRVMLTARNSRHVSEVQSGLAERQRQRAAGFNPARCGRCQPSKGSRHHLDHGENFAEKFCGKTTAGREERRPWINCDLPPTQRLRRNVDRPRRGGSSWPHYAPRRGARRRRRGRGPAGRAIVGLIALPPGRQAARTSRRPMPRGPFKTCDRCQDDPRMPVAASRRLTRRGGDRSRSFGGRCSGPERWSTEGALRTRQLERPISSNPPLLAYDRF